MVAGIYIYIPAKAKALPHEGASAVVMPASHHTAYGCHALAYPDVHNTDRRCVTCILWDSAAGAMRL